jgi:hypothetical protein
LELFNEPKNFYITYHLKKNRFNNLQQIDEQTEYLKRTIVDWVEAAK